MRILLLVAMATTALAPASAFAQVTGTVTINGHVNPKCVVGPLPSTTATFAQTVDLQELDQPNGTLKPISDLTTAFGTVTARVLCNSTTPKITVTSSPLVASSAGAPATLSNGYANTIDFTAHVAVATATNGTVTVNAASNPGTAVGPTALNSALTNNGADNVTVTADSWVSRATTPSTALLVADASYSGSIVFTITPN